MNNLDLHAALCRLSQDEIKKIGSKTKVGPKYNGLSADQLQLFHRIAMQTTAKEFDESIKSKTIPPLKLSNSELEMMKGGFWIILLAAAAVALNDYLDGSMDSAWQRGYAAGRGS